MDDVDVLVAGAGPTGLALALQAHEHGARVRILDRRPEAFRPSRALIVHPRTLEVLRPLGVTEALLERGDVAPTVQLHLGARTVTARLGPFALNDTAFPLLLFERQAEVEAVLSATLSSRGVPVERGAELVDLRLGGDSADALVRRPGGDEPLRCRYLVGCDGALSDVRRLAGIAWNGHHCRQEVVLADVELEGDLGAGAAHAVSGPRGVLFLFELGEQATWRLLATRRAGAPDAPAAGADAQPGARELQRLIDDSGVEVRITRVAWASRVPIQERLASAYRSGPAFLAGDAAHVHSPAGGQGMNTGIQDATNLGWKLAFACRTGVAGGVATRLLDSYEAERRPAARRVLAMTGTIFRAEAGLGPVARFTRSTLAPLAAPAVRVALDRPRLVACGVRVLSQLRVHYRGSALSVEGRPRPQRGPRPGDRLPDAAVTVAGERRRLHELLARPGVHVLLAAEATAPDKLRSAELVHVWRLEDRAGRGIVVLRPDGHIGLRSPTGSPSEVREWLELACAPVPALRTASGQWRA